MKKRILVVDDELSMREFLQILLSKEGYDVELANGGQDAIDKVDEHNFDVVITDVRMPNVDGIAVLKHVKKKSPRTAVVMITAFASMDQAVEAIKLGAFHYVTKPFKVDEIRNVILNAVEKQQLVEQNIQLRRELKEKYSFDKLIGGSPQMLEVYDLIQRVGPTKTNVLITGESGTGKELAARATHFNSPRKDDAFVTVNCGAIPENLIESELFGHKKGSFTGAVSDTKGLFAMADGGTLFLDEVGELPLALQVKLLRALQEHRIRPVGGLETVEVDVRIISATNKDLQVEVVHGRFREDLFYRLNVVSFKMPPLREHQEDIGMLAEHFREKFVKEQNKEIKAISREALDLLHRYRYPGNVRELENIIERAVALERSNVILPESFPQNVLNAAIESMPMDANFHLPKDGVDLNQALNQFERSLILQALRRANGVKKHAAQLLKISFRSFRYRMEKLGLDPGDEDEYGE